MKTVNGLAGVRQRGAVLVVAMIFLFLITIVAVMASRRSTMEMLMAGNAQVRLEYYEYARSVLDEMRMDGGMLPATTTAVQTTRCSSSAMETDNLKCSTTDLSLNDGSYLPADITVGFRSTYMGEVAGAAVIQADTEASADATMQSFSLYASVANADAKGGTARMEMGLWRLEPRFGNSP